MKAISSFVILFLSAVTLMSCSQQPSVPGTAEITDLHLKTGNIISCGPPDKEFGKVSFEISCDGKVRDDFNVALALLHSFEYDEAEKMFAKIITEEPGCAIAYWGIAMSS